MIKANCFGSHATRRTFVPERANTDLWPSLYKGGKVIVIMRWYKEKLITVARKMTCISFSIGPVITTLQLPFLLEVSPVKRIGVSINIAWYKTSQPIGGLKKKTGRLIRIF